MARPGIRFAAAGTQVASGYGLAGSWPCALGGHEETRSSVGWIDYSVARRPKSHAIGGGVAGRYPGTGVKVPFYSAGVPSQNQPGMAAVFSDNDFTDAPLGLGAWGQTDQTIAIHYTDRPISVLSEPSVVGESVRIGERDVASAVRGLGAMTIINPSDEFAGAVQDMGAWPGGGVVTDMYASISPEMKSTVDDLVRGGVQLYDAIKQTIAQNRVTAQVQPASSLGSMAPMLLLGGAAYLLMSGRRRSRRRR